MTYTGALSASDLEFFAAECRKWRRAGLSTDRCDRPRAEAAVAAAYEACGLPEPETVVWMDSPLGGMLAFWVLRHGYEDRLDGLFDPRRRRRQLRPPVKVAKALATPLEERLREQIMARARHVPGDLPPVTATMRDFAAVRAAVERHIGGPLLDPVDSGQSRQAGAEPGARLLWRELREVYREEPVRRLMDSVGIPVEARLWRARRGPVPGDVRQPEPRAAEGHTVPPASREEVYFEREFGGHIEPWHGLGELVLRRSVVAAAGLPPSARLEALDEAMRQVGWWWPMRGAVVLTDRPVFLKHAHEGPRVHADTHAVYADGFRVP
ncbi:DUF6745 domain-containing protein [Actinomadura sp. 9N407]|uniref:DUF6745 domain-containing protein n=1 Tax=Actinomadura sp. 9N407 TaxID=3375154 RepID=UPI0037A5EAAB